MDGDKSIKKTISTSQNQVNLIEAKVRLKYLGDKSLVEIDPNIPAHRYFRSGVEMIRMAEVYMKEKDFELAFVLYMKFLHLFLEEITKHPGYKSIPSKDKSENTEKVRKILTITEQLKNKLVAQYEAEKLQYQSGARESEERSVKDSDIQFQEEQRLQLPTDNSDQYIPSSSSRNQGLRDVVMPTKLIHEFLNIASKNTISNKETCGILAGKLEKHKLFITHLLIPKQSGSSDSCVTQNEEEIFDYQDQHNLITLGWIHTHPTQTAFLSSVDLHTHCSYQLMMAEAIAIVCAPKYDETGYYTLTPDHGLNFIARCRATGFHPHPNEQLLYTHAQHYKLDPNATISVIDLTNK